MRRFAPQNHSNRTQGSSVQAVILCGGMGTRLRNAVPELPKSLAPIAGRPFLDYLFAQLAAAGIRDLILCTGHRSEKIEAAYGHDAYCGLSLSYSIERVPLGTGGALKHASPLIHTNPFLLLNGDTFVDMDLNQLLSFHHSVAATVTLAAAPASTCERYGTVALGPRGSILAFSEKKSISHRQKLETESHINAGVYVIDRKLLHMLPDSPPALSFETQVLPRLIGNGLFAFVTDRFFIDIGVPEDYRKAQREIPQRASYACSNTR